MTEQDWLTSDDPEAMLHFITGPASLEHPLWGQRPSTDRKLRWFACAVYRSVRPHRSYVEERVACWERGQEKPASYLPLWFDSIKAGDWAISWGDCAALLRDIFGNVFRQERWRWTKPRGGDPGNVVHCMDSRLRQWLRWHDGLVRKIAQTIYDERRFEDMPVLADALEEAGCKNEEMLNHCRGEGLHVRGCWVVDLLLGKE